jgi:putative transposase
MAVRGKPRLLWNLWGRTPRIGGKNGSKVSLLVDGRGVPLSLVACGANRHDVTQLEPLLDSIVVPELRPTHEVHLCVDKGYTGAPANGVMCDRDYTPHVPVKEEERTIVLNDPSHRPRRWVVEVTHSWFKRFRKLLVRYEKTAASFVALLHLAAAVICWRQVGVIYG